MFGFGGQEAIAASGFLGASHNLTAGQVTPR